MKKYNWVGLMALGGWLLGGFTPHAAESATNSPPGRALKLYLQAKQAYGLDRTSVAKAIEFAQVTFDWAEFATSDEDREALAQEGITAARQAEKTTPDSAAAHYYLSMNLAQLARTKSLGALKLVREMEQELLRAAELDATVDFGGPDRSLADLYFETPSFPISIGNKSKARQHFEKAVQLAPEFPDNMLGLMEAHIKWKELPALQADMTRYRGEILPKARKEFTGEKWEGAWADWEKRWQDILKRAERLK